MSRLPTITLGVLMYHPDLDLEARGSWVVTMAPQTPDGPQTTLRTRTHRQGERAAEEQAELMGYTTHWWVELAPRIWQLVTLDQSPAGEEDDILINAQT